MTITITAFERSPDGGKGLARDTRVRWALEEVGQPYEVRLVSFKAMKEPAHLALHPFGQIPTYEEGDLALFETGSIVFHIAERPGATLRPGKNWPVYGYRAVNAVGVGKAQARNAACRPRLVSLLGPDRRSRNTLARPGHETEFTRPALRPCYPSDR